MRNLTRCQRSAISNHSSTSRKTKQVDLKHHRLRYQICRHASCQQIEEAFLQWRSPKVIMNCFGIKTETTIYHHAHAFQFFDLRNRGLCHALGNIIEDADTIRPTTRDVLRAVYALTHINDQGDWVHPANKSEVVHSNRPSALSTEANSIASETKSKVNPNP